MARPVLHAERAVRHFILLGCCSVVAAGLAFAAALCIYFLPAVAGMQAAKRACNACKLLCLQVFVKRLKEFFNKLFKHNFLVFNI
jgi:hypothetical protein